MANRGTAESPERLTSVHPSTSSPEGPALGTKGHADNIKGPVQSPPKDSSSQASPIESGDKEDQFLPSITQQMLSPDRKNVEISILSLDIGVPQSRHSPEDPVHTAHDRAESGENNPVAEVFVNKDE